MSPEEKRLSALGKAKEVRQYRAQLRRRIKAGRVSITEALVDPMCKTAEVGQVLGWFPYIGDRKVDRMCRACKIGSNRTIESLSAAKLAELAVHVETVQGD